MTKRNQLRASVSWCALVAAVIIGCGLAGCGAQASYRSSVAAGAFNSFNCGMTGGTYVQGRCVRQSTYVLIDCGTDAQCGDY